MATINEINGKLSGTIGPVVMVNGKYGQYIRAKGISKKAKTEAQLRQCDKMRRAAQFLQPLATVMKRLYVEPMGKRNYQQAALSQAMLQAIDENGELVPSKVLISRGTLAQISGMTMRMESDRLVLSWTDNSQAAGANADDRLVAVLYKPELSTVIDFFTDATRRQGSCNLDISKCTKGEYLIYACFLAANDMLVSNSCYVGKITKN